MLCSTALRRFGLAVGQRHFELVLGLVQIQKVAPRRRRADGVGRADREMVVLLGRAEAGSTAHVPGRGRRGRVVHVARLVPGHGRAGLERRAVCVWLGTASTAARATTRDYPSILCLKNIFL